MTAQTRSFETGEASERRRRKSVEEGELEAGTCLKAAWRE